MKHKIGLFLVVVLFSVCLNFTPVSATGQRSLSVGIGSNNAPLSTNTPSVDVGCTENVGDVPALIAAINAANSTPQADTIVLGSCVYTLTTSIPNSGWGLPNITSPMTITGKGTTITRSSANGTPGFGILIVAPTGNLTINGITISNGSDSGIWNEGGTLTVTNSTLTNNMGVLGGGGITNSGTLTVINTTFSGNTVPFYPFSVSSAGGGGIFTGAGTVTVTDSIFTGNSSSTYVGGGGILIGNSTVTITGSTFTDNTAKNPSAGGGGITTTSGGKLTVQQSTLSGNSASAGGGIANNNFGTVTVQQSTLSGNSANGGGGIFNGSFSTLTVQQSTISGNSATNNGGGILNYSFSAQYSSTVTLGTSLVAGNTAATSADIGNTNGSITSQGSNLIGNNSTVETVFSPITPTLSINDVSVTEGAAAQFSVVLTRNANHDLVGTAAAPINPLLAPLADNGGPTQTRMPQPGSPAINSGPATSPFSTDQRGEARVQGGAVDIGAVEADSTVIGQLVTVNYATSDGSATAGADYPATSGTLAIATGVTTQTISIATTQDTIDEVDETFTVTLSLPTNATLSDSSALGTIVDDDAPPLVSLSDAAVTEGGTAVFTATLSAASSYTITVAYSTTNGTAIDGVDYTATNGMLTFAAGETTQTINVATTQDTVDEANETLTVTLSNATNATIADAAGNGTIVDDDATIVYLPLVLYQTTSQQLAPDLVVDAVTVSSTDVAVVIRNAGTAPVVDAFWVDVYLNPTTPPTAVNQLWETQGTQGLVWGVQGASLPLNPGQTLTLHVGGLWFRGELSTVKDSTIPAGTTVYAQVDSANTQTTYGGVFEGHERNGGTYNNIRGPQVTTVTAHLTLAQTPTRPELGSLPNRD